VSIAIVFASPLLKMHVSCDAIPWSGARRTELASVHALMAAVIFLQDACLQHKYIRSKDSSHIFERPERLRAVKIGLCAAIARLEDSLQVSSVATSATAGKREEDSEADLLVAAIENLRLEQDTAEPVLPKGHPVQVVQSSAKVDILNHPAVKYIHGDVDGDVYLEKLSAWARHSAEKISNGQSEIPSELPQGDLYSKYF